LITQFPNQFFTEDDEVKYRQTLAKQREDAEKRKPRKVSSKYEEISSTGLSGAVVALMARKKEDDGSSSSDESNSSSYSYAHRRDRKRSKRKSREKRKRRNREKKSKRRKRSDDQEKNKDNSSDESKTEKSLDYVNEEKEIIYRSREKKKVVIIVIEEVEEKKIHIGTARTSVIAIATAMIGKSINERRKEKKDRNLLEEIEKDTLRENINLVVYRFPL